jgi:hypothetical protein
MSTRFVSSGPDPFSHLRPHLANVPPAQFDGDWTTIELQPDPFARQRFTVGVAVADARGGFAFRLLDDLAKFECLYDREAVAAFRTLMENAEHCLLRARKERAPLRELSFEAEALCLGDFWPTAGASAEDIVNRLYFDVVPFVPKEDRKTREFLTLDNAAVRQRVDQELKRIAGLSFERIVTEPQRVILDQATGEPHRLDFNLEPNGRAGSVISAVYKTPDRVELNFLRASRDLATYGRLRGLESKLAIFVMTPAKGAMPPADLERMENVLGEQSWSLEKQGFVVATHDDAHLLAQDVFDWSGFGEPGIP